MQAKANVAATVVKISFGLMLLCLVAQLLWSVLLFHGAPWCESLAQTFADYLWFDEILSWFGVQGPLRQFNQFSGCQS